MTAQDWELRIYSADSDVDPYETLAIENRTEDEASQEAAAIVDTEYPDAGDWTLTPVEETPTMTATLLPVVTDDEAAAINAARDALAAIKERAQYLAGDPPAGPDGWPEARSQDFGRLIGYAAVAHNLLFDVLNVAHAYCNAPLTDAQLHNREEA